jgi:hypothetical protein
MTNRQMISLHVEPCKDKLYIGDNMMYLSQNKKHLKHSVVNGVSTLDGKTIYTTIEGV